jgi:hypothetical protein
LRFSYRVSEKLDLVDIQSGFRITHKDVYPMVAPMFSRGPSTRMFDSDNFPTDLLKHFPLTGNSSQHLKQGPVIHFVLSFVDQSFLPGKRSPTNHLPRSQPSPDNGREFIAKSVATLLNARDFLDALLRHLGNARPSDRVHQRHLSDCARLLRY